MVPSTGMGPQLWVWRCLGCPEPPERQEQKEMGRGRAGAGTPDLEGRGEACGFYPKYAENPWG